MFSIVFENASYDNYYTEKITDCFSNGTVPVYWGDPKIGESFDMGGIILWDDSFDPSILNVDLYNSMIGSVRNNLYKVSVIESADDILYNQIVNIL
jgi:hypothetical protein